MLTTGMHSHKPLHTCAHSCVLHMHHKCTHMHQTHTYTHTLYAMHHLCRYILCTHMHIYTCAHTSMRQCTHTCACCSYMCHAYSPVSCFWPCFGLVYLLSRFLQLSEMFLSISPSHPTHLHPVEQNSHLLLSRVDLLFTRGHTFADYEKHVHWLDKATISVSWAEWLPGALTWLSAGHHGPALCAAPLVGSEGRRTALPGPRLRVCFQATPTA